MIAEVQYNDFVGTAAADISDYYLNSINEYLKRKYPSFDWDRFYCIGCEFYTAYGQYPSVFFICRDNNDSKYKRLQPSEEYSLEEFFDLFKRFRIILGSSIIKELEIDSSDDSFIPTENDIENQ